MPLLSETIILRDAVLRIEFGGENSYKLSYGDLVIYEPGRRLVRGRVTRYQPRSVEQLRYDFERDVEAVGGRLG